MEFKATPVITSVRLMKSNIIQKPPLFVHGRPFSSLTYRLKGRISVQTADAEFLSEPSSLTFLPQGTDYRTEVLESGEMYVLHVATDLPPTDSAACIALSENDPFIISFEQAIHHYLTRGCDLHCMSMVYRILAEAQKRFHPSPRIPYRMKQCKGYIDENFCDPSLRIGDLAAMCSLSEVYFRREFSRFYGQSPLEYIKARRIEQAKLLLETGLYSVTEVAFASGFESSAYFSAEFRRLTGMSPSDYMKQ